jgi:hypothetical protein
MRKRLIGYDDLCGISTAVESLRFARDRLRLAGANNAASYVARALKSAQGAFRHAEGRFYTQERAAGRRLRALK